MSSEKKPKIQPTQDGPYLVTGLDNLATKNGPLDSKAKMALCRCGGSNNKPFCDGTHAKIGFSSAKLEGRVEDKCENVEGEKITIHDNRGICAHAGFCTDGLPSVFRLGTEPWIDAAGGTHEAIIATISQCPSGALSCSVEGVEQSGRERAPAILIAPHGPYVVTGGPELLDTERGEGASTEHFTMCRCGGSKNKPFCDGTHWHIKFRDDKNA